MPTARMAAPALCALLAGLEPPASPPGLPSPVGHAEYALDITLRPTQTRLEVSGTVRLADAPMPRDTLALVLSSRMKDVRIELAEPAGLAGTLSTDSAEGDRTWRLALARPLPAGVPVVLKFSYGGDSLSAPQLRVTPEGSLAGGGGEVWYPRLAFDSAGVGTLRFRVPPGETVVSNGALDERASDPARGVFAFVVRQGVKFGFAGARYHRYGPAGSRLAGAPSGPRVTLYLLRERPDAEAMRRRVERVLAALVREFGPLRAREYAVAEVDFGGSVAGTSEFGFFLADRSHVDRGLPLPFIAHELGHAWWGNLVGTKPGPARTMVTEGIASYGMIRAIEAVEGRAAADAYRQSRYHGYESTGSPAEYFRLAAAGIELPIGTTTPRSQLEILTMHRMANTRGWMLLDMLAREVGRERLAAALRAVLRAHAGEAVSWLDARRAVEASAGRDIRWFFDDWFDRTGAPEYALTWHRTSGGVAGLVTQREPAFRATLPVELRGRRGERLVYTVRVVGPSTSFRWRDVPFAVDTVVLDPRFEVLRWTPAVTASALGRAPLTRADFERRFGSAEKAVALYRAALDSVAEPDTAGVRFAVEYGLAALLAARGDSVEARERVESALREPVRDADVLPRAYLLLARLAWAAGDREGARHAARAAFTADYAAGGTSGVGETVRALPWFSATPHTP